MRQDAARSIAEQLNRPDTSGAAGFKLGSSVELRNALCKWEDENDPLAVLIRNRLSGRNKRQASAEEEEMPKVERVLPDRKKEKKPAANKYKEKLASLSPEEIEALREKQREASRLRSEKLLKERMASMTEEELQIFRQRSERMKQFRAELKERKQQAKNTP